MNYSQTTGRFQLFCSAPRQQPRQLCQEFNPFAESAGALLVTSDERQNKPIKVIILKNQLLCMVPIIKF